MLLDYTILNHILKYKRILGLRILDFGYRIYDFRILDIRILVFSRWNVKILIYHEDLKQYLLTFNNLIEINLNSNNNFLYLNIMCYFFFWKSLVPSLNVINI